MNFLQRIFGYRTNLAPSGSLPKEELRKILLEFCFNAQAVHGLDLVVYDVTNTNSMLPEFDSNALLVMEKVKFGSVREGDVGTYWSKLGQLVVHKMNNWTGKGWWPVGTGNASADPELVTEQNFDRKLFAVFYALKDANTDR